MEVTNYFLTSEKLETSMNSEYTYLEDTSNKLIV